MVHNAGLRHSLCNYGVHKATGAALLEYPLPCCCTPTGTEDGHIHKCSTSYSEQYLETYHGHIGPVYGLQWSPFNAGLFLSCSGDWTIRMWQEGRQQPLMTFQSSNKEVNGPACSALCLLNGLWLLKVGLTVGMYACELCHVCTSAQQISCAVHCTAGWHPVHNK